jgi:hypothetical protein
LNQQYGTYFHPDQLISLEKAFPDTKNTIKCPINDYQSHGNKIVSTTSSSITYEPYCSENIILEDFKPFVARTPREKLFCNHNSFDLSNANSSRISKDSSEYSGSELRKIARDLGISSVGGKAELIAKITRAMGLKQEW